MMTSCIVECSITLLNQMLIEFVAHPVCEKRTEANHSVNYESLVEAKCSREGLSVFDPAQFQHFLLK